MVTARDQEGPVRRLAAILAADVVGYSRLMGADEAGTVARLREVFREVVQPAVTAQRGRVFKLMRDAFLAEFGSAVGAVTCAAALQEALAAAPGEPPIVLRIGVHLGDVLVEGGDLLGDGVNVAARIEGVAEPGGVALSGAVAEAVRGRVPFGLEDLGEQALKNIERPVRVFRLVAQDAAPVVAAPPALPLPDKPSLVVLPFQNMSGDAEQDYFADGMVEDITTALSRIRWLFVIARNSAFTYKGRAVDVRHVGRELGVRYVLEGSVRKVGGRVRISAQLIEAASGAHLWAERFDGSLDDVFDLQDRITETVAAAIEPSLQRAEVERVRRKPTESLDAYDLFLRAEPHRGVVPQLYEHNLEILDRALRLDPGFVRARARAALVRAESEHFGVGSPEDWALAVVMARDVIADSAADDPVALRWAAQALMLRGQELDRAHAAMMRALALNPNSAAVLGGAAWAANYAGRPGEAVELFERAMRLSPLDPEMPRFLQGAASASLQLGQFDQALGYAKRGMALMPDRAVVAHRVTIGALHGLGLRKEARQAALEFSRQLPASARVMEAWMDRLFSNKKYVRFLSDALREAGLPE